MLKKLRLFEIGLGKRGHLGSSTAYSKGGVRGLKEERTLEDYAI